MLITIRSFETDAVIPASAIANKVKFGTASGHPMARIDLDLWHESIVYRNPGFS
jgi:hypothetical protein